MAFGNGNPMDIDEDLHSRQLAVYGRETMRWLYASNVLVSGMQGLGIEIELGNPKAILAVSALVRAMKEMNKVVILHCVWRQGQGNVVIGVLTRNVSEKDSVPDSFYFNVLPFAEDVREFQFPSFINFSSWQLNEQQQEAADNLVKMFDFFPAGKEEVLPPEFTPNPVLEHLSKTWGYCDSVLQLNLVQGYCHVS